MLLYDLAIHRVVATVGDVLLLASAAVEDVAAVLGDVGRSVHW